MAQVTYQPGDVNQDGFVNVTDVTALIDMLLNGPSQPSEPQSGDIETITVNGVSFNMVYVASGTFEMGAPPEAYYNVDHCRPVHQVTLSEYYIGQTEVTQELWTAVMGSNPSYYVESNQQPVHMITWANCQTFITKLNQLTGKNFRLPTEAEWEYAARGGRQSHDYLYSGSNDISLVGWYRDNSGATSHPVAQKSPNELGLYDMTGNVWEMCADVYTRYDKKPFAEGSYLSTPHRSTRGGCYGAYQRDCRATDRGYTLPDFRGKYNGLRLAR